MILKRRPAEVEHSATRRAGKKKSLPEAMD
jgi:hypothetical protein